MPVRLVEQDAPPPANEVAEWAEEIAKDARNGDVVSVVFVYVRRDGTWGTGQRGRQNSCETIGRLEGLKLDLLKQAEV